MSEPPSQPPPSPGTKATPRALRPVYLLSGFGLVGLGLIGVVVPGMPTTIFLILAAGCFARSSPKLENWLLTHPKFGPPIVAWRETGAIPRKVKIIAVASMVISMGIVCLSPAPRWVDWLCATIIVASAAFVITRPERGRA
jgi:uncharacterized membrane protein YbaN (DUF454 family)